MKKFGNFEDNQSKALLSPQKILMSKDLRNDCALDFSF